MPCDDLRCAYSFPRTPPQQTGESQGMTENVTVRYAIKLHYLRACALPLRRK